MRVSLVSGVGVVATVALTLSAPPTLLGPTGRKWVEPVTGMRFVLLPGGTYQMGSPPGERWRESQEVLHEVTISRPIYVGQHEVTQEQWRIVMGTQPSRFRGALALPVENITWLEARQFLQRLTARSENGIFRLPTEAEWEYACRAGTMTAYGIGAAISSSDANIDPRAPDDTSPDAPDTGTRPVGSYRANPWGLFDMHGNVWEWTSDAHCAYGKAPARDPQATCDSPLKVIRGGSWRFRADSARCALRYTHAPVDRGYSLGFRVVREPGAGE
jgi:formylglycine-generating enzyme required for sulfatase activity